MFATSRSCRARGIWRTTRHTDKRAALGLYTAADRQPTNQVSAWQAEWGSRPTRQTRTTVAVLGRGLVGEDVARMLRGNCFRGIAAYQLRTRERANRRQLRETAEVDESNHSSRAVCCI